MNTLFLKILNMSISAGWLVLAVLILRLLMKRSPRWLHVLLWGLVALRLVMPISPRSMFSLIPSAETVPMDIAMTETPQIESGIPMINGVINPVLSETGTPTLGASVNPLQVITTAASYLWLLGVLGMLLYTVISYLRLRYRLRTAVRLRDGIYQSENAVSPFVLGLVKPGIYLPYHIGANALGYVVAHEEAHIRRKDHLWKPLGFLFLTVYWFHPLLWLAYILLCRDIELACDEKVIGVLGNAQRADYTEALLACSVNRRMISACPLAFGEVGVKQRVKSVMHYKKPAFWVILLSLLIALIAAVCFLTDPIEDEEPALDITVAHSDSLDTDQETIIAWGEKIILEAAVEQNRIGKTHGYRVTGAELTTLEMMPTYVRFYADTDFTQKALSGETYAFEFIYRMEYRLSFDHPERVSLEDGMKMDGDRLTEWTQNGQPYLFGHWEVRGEEEIVTPICVTDLQTMEACGTPEVYALYNATNAVYVVASMKMYHEYVASLPDPPKPYLTIEALKALVTEKGAQLAWDDFFPYLCHDTGNEYSLCYPINDVCYLMLRGNAAEAPTVTLVSEADPFHRITVPTEDIDVFLTELSLPPVTVSPTVNVPDAAIAWGKELVAQAAAVQNRTGQVFGYRVTDAELTALTRINTGTAGLSSGEDLYRLEYRISFDHPERVPMTEGKQMDGERLTEYSSGGQPYLLLHWEFVGEDTEWTPICTVSDLTIAEVYSTPKMLAQYGNAYTAAAVELTNELLQPVSDDTEKPYLTIAELKECIAAHGEALSWEHFSAYRSWDVGSGLYILYYPIDSDCHLLIGGVPTAKPMYIRLRSELDHEKWIDLPSGDIDAFLADLPLLAVKSANAKIQPYLHFKWSEVWGRNGWMSGDGFSLANRFPQIADEIPAFITNGDLEVFCREDVDVQSVSLYDESFTVLPSDAVLIDAASLSLPLGTYYLGIHIKVRGTYVPSENKYETSGYECLYKITVIE